MRSAIVYGWIFVTTILLLQGCDKESDPERDILGKWSTTEFKVGILIDEVPILHWYQTKHYATEEEATAFANAIIAEIEENLTGNMEFLSDHSYKINLGDEPEETGTWQLVEENQKIAFTSDETNETNESDIKSLSSSLLILGFIDTNRGDVDSDQMNERMWLSIELTLKK